MNSKEELLKGCDKRVIAIKPCTVADLAILYNVSRQTMHRWIKPFRKELGAKNGNYFTVDQVRKIFELLGHPFELEKYLNDEKPDKLFPRLKENLLWVSAA